MAFRTRWSGVCLESVAFMPRFCCGMEAAPENSKLVIRAVIYDFSAFDLLMSTSWELGMDVHTADEDFGAGSLSVKDTYQVVFFEVPWGKEIKTIQALDNR